MQKYITKNDIKHQIENISSQCVKCGLCLPSCPTNKLTKLEGNSPRGRIALWQNIARGSLEPTTKTTEYLDNCLSCGACNQNCPAGVDFLKLNTLGRSYQYTKKAPLIANILDLVITNRYLNNLSRYFIFIYQLIFKPISQIIFRLSGLSDTDTDTDSNSNSNSGSRTKQAVRILNILPKIQFFHKTKNKPEIKYLTEVILFTGCVNKLAAQTTIKSSIELLNKLKVKIHIVNNLHCCGALYKHNGNLAKYNTIETSNIKAIKNYIENNKSISHILTMDTGCQSTLDSMQNHLDSSKLRIINIELFILDLILDLIKNKPDKLNHQLKPNPGTIYIYSPCSQRNSKDKNTPNITKKLLKLLLPKVNIINLDIGLGCCGSAGNYMLKNPKTANQYASQVSTNNSEAISKILKKNTTIYTSNIGCALHLQQNIANNSIDNHKTKYPIKITLKHPINLLNELIL